MVICSELSTKPRDTNLPRESSIKYSEFINNPDTLNSPRFGFGDKIIALK